jgi:hypothetical protein
MCFFRWAAGFFPKANWGEATDVSGKMEHKARRKSRELNDS